MFNELCGIYGPQIISMRTVFRWIKVFKAGKFSVEDDSRPGRPKTSVTKAYIAVVDCGRTGCAIVRQRYS